MKQLLQWETWVYGLFAGFIGGGASAVVSSVSLAAVFPDTFAIAAHFKNFMLLVLITFLSSGLLAAMAFLAKSPLPAIETTKVTEKAVTPTADGGVNIKTVEVTSTDTKGADNEKK